MKRLVAILMIFTLCIALCGCEETYVTTVSSSYEYSDFDLVSDSKTKVVYIDNKVHSDNGLSYHIYTPYYSKNGKLCRYEEGKMMEVIE